MRLTRKCTNCSHIGKVKNYMKSVTIKVTCPKCKHKTFVARLP